MTCTSMRPPTFSIVMPAFNAERTIAAAIRSALAQSREDFELIVVDDGSTDDTAEIAGSFASDPRLVLIRSTNGGPAVARNLALAQARGRYVSLLDSDDLYLPTYLAETQEALLRNPEPASVSLTRGFSTMSRCGFVESTNSPTMRPPRTIRRYGSDS